MAFCNACGTSLPSNAAFCPNCGVRINSAGTAGTSDAGQNAAAPAYTTAATSSALSDNVAGMLCYIFVIAIVFLLVEPYNRNRFIRFHAFQSLLFALAWILLHAVWAIPFIGWALWPVLELAFLITWIVLLIKAYQGQMFKLPVLGDFAEQHAG